MNEHSAKLGGLLLKPLLGESVPHVQIKCGVEKYMVCGLEIVSKV